ncbi:hypothetical protein DRJ17_05290 [Candidatus Woesearchaeota archaeon]|nr:MAG: hypothetical protein DRJ17_05290 [Candidatus Woesearchaeota archaeon]
MEKVKLLEQLFDEKLIAIINVFLQAPEREFYLKEISQAAKVPMATTHRILQKLKKASVIKERSISKFKVYTLMKNENADFLSTIMKHKPKAVETFIHEVIKVEDAIDRIILHGEERADRANLLLIGEDIDGGVVKSVAADIESQFNYRITFMILTQEQYAQMIDMGLYSGKKKIIWEKSK